MIENIKAVWCFVFHWRKQERVGRYIFRCNRCQRIWNGGV